MEVALIKGTVKSFDAAKGFGWLSGPAGDIFVHHSACDGQVPSVGALVTYEAGVNPANGKACALNVRAVGPDAELSWLRAQQGGSDGAKTT
jgi:cold shock CspA family protein